MIYFYFINYDQSLLLLHNTGVGDRPWDYAKVSYEGIHKALDRYERLGLFYLKALLRELWQDLSSRSSSFSRITLWSRNDYKKKMIEPCPNYHLKVDYRANWQWASHLLVLQQEDYLIALQRLFAQFLRKLVVLALLCKENYDLRKNNK